MFSFNRFESLRASKGITKKYIADALDRTPTLIQDWKSGKSAPNKEQLRIVADILGTTPEYLSGETDEKSPPAPKHEDERNETMARIIEAASLLQPVQQEFLLAFLQTVVQNAQEETRQSQRSRTASPATVSAGAARANASIHP